MCQQGVCDHLGRLAPGAGTRHGDVGGDVAVLHVGGDLHDKGGQLCLGQGAVGHSSLGGCGQQSAGLVQRSLPGVVVLVGLFKISHGSDSFHSLRELSIPIHMGHGHFQTVAAHQLGAVGVQQVAEPGGAALLGQADSRSRPRSRPSVMEPKPVS